MRISWKVRLWGLWNHDAPAIMWQLRSFCTPCTAPETLPKGSYASLKCDSKNRLGACRKSGLESYAHQILLDNFFWWFLRLLVTHLCRETLVTNLFTDGCIIHFIFPNYASKISVRIFGAIHSSLGGSGASRPNHLARNESKRGRRVRLSAGTPVNGKCYHLIPREKFFSIWPGPEFQKLKVHILKIGCSWGLSLGRSPPEKFWEIKWYLVHSKQ